MPFGAPRGDSPKADPGQGQGPQPTISLPKGGGAIRGMGEKFAANPVTGTMTVPIATSPGRSGFGPQLSLSYDSGAGNGFADLDAGKAVVCERLVEIYSKRKSNPLKLPQRKYKPCQSR